MGRIAPTAFLDFVAYKFVAILLFDEVTYHGCQSDITRFLTVILLIYIRFNVGFLISAFPNVSQSISMLRTERRQGCKYCLS